MKNGMGSGLHNGIVYVIDRKFKNIYLFYSAFDLRQWIYVIFLPNIPVIVLFLITILCGVL
jgi:hypothetical protein